MLKPQATLRICTAICLVTLAAPPTADAQRRPRARLQAAPVPSVSLARISGTVITRDEPPKPVKRARVRVRARDGRVVNTVTADDQGHFSVPLDQPGSYYVEVVDESGRVLAVEDVGQTTVAVGPGENSTTILRVPTRIGFIPWGGAAGTIIGAASAAGVGGVLGSGQAASPER